MSRPQQPTLRILGCRGVPAAHGGFETFAEALALHLVARGWRVVVYGQEHGARGQRCDHWNGIERVQFSVPGDGPLATMWFDWLCIGHAAAAGDLCLTLGYNTAAFNLRLRLAGVPQVINMDGIEWQRAKWGPVARAWLRFNERAAIQVADHLIADHPEIAAHLQERMQPGSRGAHPTPISTIAYGATAPDQASPAAIDRLRLQPYRYLTLVARPEPENGVLELVRAYGARRRACTLVVVGDFEADRPYARAVRAAAGPDVRFVGPIYDKADLGAIRRFALAYLHGHSVGGTNPSLLEAMAAGNAVLAHDNRFNRWVAGDAALYYQGPDDLPAALDALLGDIDTLAARRLACRARFQERFRWEGVLRDYEDLLTHMLPRPQRVAAMPAPAAQGASPLPRTIMSGG
ncbi:MAG: DUF1972 domain-containing protein [Aquabacterium sp.]